MTRGQDVVGQKECNRYFVLDENEMNVKRQ
jgi:hypothetical protein